jgi:hypothetical protein
MTHDFRLQPPLQLTNKSGFDIHVSLSHQGSPILAVMVEDQPEGAVVRVRKRAGGLSGNATGAILAAVSPSVEPEQTDIEPANRCRSKGEL